MSTGRILLLALALTAASGCAATTVDTVDTTTPPDVTTTTVDVARPLDELLASIQGEVDDLSERVVQHDGDDEALARIEAYWEVARPQIEASDPDLLAQFDAAVDYARRAVDRRRPADADKAANNLRVLITHLS